MREDGTYSEGVVTIPGMTSRVGEDMVVRTSRWRVGSLTVVGIP